MHARIEDLLKIRDGEPIESAERERLLSDPAALAELQRLRRVQQRLCALEELRPPAGVWSRVEARLEARDPLVRRGWFALAVAASFAIAAVGYLLRSPQTTQAPARPVAESAPAGGAGEGPAPPEHASYADLLEQSARLERMLFELPERPRVVRFETAGAIASLEDQIAVIDLQLSVGAAAGLAPEGQQTLWRNRVDVMDALLQVRYAQTRASEF